MKNLMSLWLGLALALGTMTMVASDDKKHADKKHDDKKHDSGDHKADHKDDHKKDEKKKKDH